MNRISSRIIITVLILSTLYAILRYHVFKDVAWSRFPLFIMNKAISFAGFILLVISFSAGSFFRKQAGSWHTAQKFLGRTGFVLIILHIVMSLLLFRPEVYDKFFTEEGILNGTGELSMMLGCMGMVALIMIQNSYQNYEKDNFIQKVSRSGGFYLAMLAFSVLHIGILGFEGWMTPREWPGGLPSVSFISAVFFLSALLLLLFRKKT
jgi:hypothetical protein